MGKNAEAQAVREREAKIHREWLHRGRYIQLRKDVIEIENAPIKTWELIVHPGAVAIIPIDAKGDLILVEQWRCAIEKITLEIPPGTLNSGELPLGCAQRELQEETGYKAHILTPLGGCYSAPGISNEYVYLYIGEKLEKSPLIADDTDLIDIRTVSVKKALEMIEEGSITDAKTIVGILRYQSRQS